MASFDKYTNHRDNAGVSGVVFGAEKPLLEVEMNEVQEIQKSMLRRAIKNIIGDGVTDFSKIVYEGGAVKVKEGCALAVDGYMVESTGLSLTASSGTVYLQVWEETATYSETLKKEGNQQDSATVTNWFKDNRSDTETSRRKVVKYTLATSTNSGRHNLAIAKVADGVMTRLCKEISFSNLSNTVIDLQVQLGTLGEGVMGVEVDLTNNSVKRMGDNQYWSAGEDYNQSPVYGNRRRCNVTDDGKIVAFFGDEAYTETGALETQVGDVVVGTKVQCMVMQPKFYYKRIPIRLEKQVDSTYQVKGYQVKGYHMTKWIDLISPTPRDGFKLHPAFKKGDTELDYYFIGENDGCLENTDGYDLDDNTITLGSTPYTDIKFSSIAGAKPASGASEGNTKNNNSLTRNAIRKTCANRGEDWQQLDFTIASAEQMLFVVEYSTFNIQAVADFGSGVTDMPYITNVNDSIPNPENPDLGNGSGKIHVKYTHYNGTEYTKNVPVYRGVKNPFGNIWKFVDGFMRKHSAGSDCNEAHWQNGSKAFSDNIADYIPCGFSCATAEGYVKAFGYSEDCDFSYMTSKIGGDSSKPVGDYYYVNMSSNNNYIALLGAHWTYGADAGLFFWRLSSVASYRSCDVGGRLCRKTATIEIVAE